MLSSSKAFCYNNPEDMEQPIQLNYSAIAKHISNSSIIGIGESTHGTHEFFQAKVELFKLLVQHHGFNTFILESIDDRCDDINSYIHAGDGHPEELVNKLFYVYRTTELLDLVKWLHKHHDRFPVRFLGIDKRKYADDYSSGYTIDRVNVRDERMALVIKRYTEQNPGAKSMIWAHDTHVAAYINPPELAPDTRHVPMGEHLRNWFGNNYYSVAQLFGSGYFNAALIEESGEFDNSRLVRHYARKVSKWFWENRFAKEIAEPVFLEGPDFGGLVKEGEILYKRALGWGVQRSVMHDQGNVTYIDIGRAFNAAIFFPHATASHLLRDGLGKST